MFLLIIVFASVTFTVMIVWLCSKFEGMNGIANMSKYKILISIFGVYIFKAIKYTFKKINCYPCNSSSSTNTSPEFYHALMRRNFIQASSFDKLFLNLH